MSDKTQQNAALSPVQVTVLAALLSGSTVTDAAAAAGVDRVTVHRWLAGDVAFQAAWNEGRAELLAHVRIGLLKIGQAAVECCRKAIDGGDARIALEVLKGLGTLAPPNIGSANPKMLAAENHTQQQLAELAMSLYDTGPRAAGDA
jgi:hypothetical protein